MKQTAHSLKIWLRRLTLVHVHEIGNLLEGEERYRQGQNNVEIGNLDTDYRFDILYEEPGIFEIQ